MNFSNDLNQVNSKEYLTRTFSPYLLSDSKNQSNNPLSVYISSNMNQSKPKLDFNSNNYVKKSLNLDISPTINNSLIEQQKKEYNIPLRRFSSFSNHISSNSNINISHDKSKKTLILDLDETLVHSQFTPFSRKSDLILNINIEGENKTLYVLKRPHVDKFLYELSMMYEIIIFTASISQYANPLLDELDKNKYIKYRLFREHCTFTRGIYIKDLKIFERKINNMIIIDNNPLSYDNNIENGIPILSWYDDINDNELLKLLPLLKYMSNSNIQDVRPVISQVVNRRRNEIDYSAIKRIIGESEDFNSDSETNYSSSGLSMSSNNNYRKYNKSEEPKSKLINKKEYIKKDYNYNYNQRNNTKPLKNNYSRKYGNENTNILNSKYSMNNIYNYNSQSKGNNSFNSRNIDKKDPYGTRTSIFSPEEYNVSSYSKSLNELYNNINNIDNDNDNNKNKLKMNNIEYDNFSKTMKAQRGNNNNSVKNYINRYSYSSLNSRKEGESRPLTPKVEYKRRSYSELNTVEYLSSNKKISKKLSLVELTKRALHLDDDDYININKTNKNIIQYSPVKNDLKANRNSYKYNNYFNKENKLIYNDYIVNNKYINNYKSNKDMSNNNLNNEYFNSYPEESKNFDENNDTSNKGKKLILMKKMNSFNERFMKTDKSFYTKRKESNNEYRNKLLDRMTNEKINNFLNNNKSNTNKLYQTGNNFYNNYGTEKNYSLLNKDNYFNYLKKPSMKTKNDINSDKENFSSNNQLIYSRNDENYKNLYNNRYSLINSYDNKENSTVILNHKSASYINDKLYSLKNAIKLNKKSSEQNNYHPLTRSLSYINSNENKDRQKFFSKISPKNTYNKENISDNVNYNFEYGENLNYKYDLVNVENKPKYSKNNNKYYNTFSRTNYLKY